MKKKQRTPLCATIAVLSCLLIASSARNVGLY